MNATPMPLASLSWDPKALFHSAGIADHIASRLRVTQRELPPTSPNVASVPTSGASPQEIAPFLATR